MSMAAWAAALLLTAGDDLPTAGLLEPVSSTAAVDWSPEPVGPWSRALLGNAQLLLALEASRQPQDLGVNANLL